MKRFVFSAICVIAAVSALVSCDPKPQPDGKCEITAFSLPASQNSALTADINGAIDASSKTITLVIPTSVTESSFVPAFTASEFDAVSIGGVQLESGVTKVAISNGTKVSVVDEVSAMNAEYTIAIQANDEKAALSSLVFKKADNADLSEDVAPAEFAPEMIVRVPSAAFRKELVLTVAAGQNDAIKVNNTAVESGSSIKVDTNFPIDITVSDEIAGASTKYVLKVGKILGYVVSKLGTLSEGSIGDFTMTVNPADKLPYFAYVRKVGDEKNNNIAITKWDGSVFTQVGPSAFADASSRAASKPKVAFGKDGSIYAYYLGGEVASRPTVKQLNGGEWATLGTAGITPQNCNTTYLYPFFVHPATGKPAFFWNGNTKNQASYRVMNYAGYSGSDWAVNVVSAAPALGSGGTTNSGMYYTSSAVVTEDKVFIGTSFNEFGYYVHEVSADGSLVPIVENFLPADAPYGLPASLKLDAGPGGDLYLFAADAAVKVMQVFSVDKSGKVLKPYGAGLPVAISANGSVTENSGFAINPAGGLAVAVVDKADKVPGFYYLNDSMQWDTFTVDAPVASKSVYYIDFNADGKGFISYLSANGVELYGISLEDDILPE